MQGAIKYSLSLHLGSPENYILELGTKFARPRVRRSSTREFSLVTSGERQSESVCGLAWTIPQGGLMVS